MDMATLMTATENVCNFVFHWCGVWLVMNSATVLVMNSATVLVMKMRGLRLVAVKCDIPTTEKDNREADENTDKETTVELTEDEKTGLLASAAALFHHMSEVASRRAKEDAAESEEAMPESEAEPGGADELSDQQEGEDGHAD